MSTNQFSNPNMQPENDENMDFDDYEEQTQQQDQKMGKAFRLIKKLDAGSFGDIYLGKNLETNMEVAVKVESVNTKTPMLQYEAMVYNYILKEKELSLAEKLWRERQKQIPKGFPEVYFCSNEGDHVIMIMQNLGPNLEDLFQICSRKFSPKTVCMIAIQLITRLQFIHEKYMVHRDIKPANFCIGKLENKDLIYMIDLAFAKKYVEKDGQHIQFDEGKNFTGTMMYASVNTHRGFEYSRRDDLESLAYMLLYFLKGFLPWQNLKQQTKKEKMDRTIEKKIQNPEQSLFKGVNEQEFKDLLIYAQNLNFDDKPDYDMLRKSFTDLMVRNEWENDSVFSWNIVAQSPEPQITAINEQMESQQNLLYNNSPVRKSQAN